jgi:hypothetical protein
VVDVGREHQPDFSDDLCPHMDRSASLLPAFQGWQFWPAGRVDCAWICHDDSSAGCGHAVALPSHIVIGRVNWPQRVECRDRADLHRHDVE